jgi:hypothetical protein
VLSVVLLKNFKAFGENEDGDPYLWNTGRLTCLCGPKFRPTGGSGIRCRVYA